MASRNKDKRSTIRRKKEKNTRQSYGVVAQCAQCGDTRKILPGEIGANEFPMCDACYTPMLVKTIN